MQFELVRITFEPFQKCTFYTRISIKNAVRTGSNHFRVGSNMYVLYKDLHQNTVRTGSNHVRTVSNMYVSYKDFHKKCGSNRFESLSGRFEQIRFIQGFPLNCGTNQVESLTCRRARIVVSSVPRSICLFENASRYHQTTSQASRLSGRWGHRIS